MTITSAVSLTLVASTPLYRSSSRIVLNWSGPALLVHLRVAASQQDGAGDRRADRQQRHEKDAAGVVVAVARAGCAQQYPDDRHHGQGAEPCPQYPPAYRRLHRPSIPYARMSLLYARMALCTRSLRGRRLPMLTDVIRP